MQTQNSDFYIVLASGSPKLFPLGFNFVLYPPFIYLHIKHISYAEKEKQHYLQKQEKLICQTAP